MKFDSPWDFHLAYSDNKVCATSVYETLPMSTSLRTIFYNARLRRSTKAATWQQQLLSTSTRDRICCSPIQWSDCQHWAIAIILTPSLVVTGLHASWAGFSC
ncbi:hypothetical protein BDV98DRAFT_273898 [Pterulicium gracile]|uniref:Uncharacterized protein n=1 Tax=Pterulicium gracile TaxID=1884261 RepID=A0A5C3Q7M6_9AGAR|nr:hypothetical protein BDV98DRAFT_273898 [Pterula gracilis]